MIPSPLSADPIDLPPEVAAALAAPEPPGDMTVDGDGIPFHAFAWGDPSRPPLLMLHGVTASAAIWWRVGPALAAAGRRVIALDLPGHGSTGGWRGHHRFADTASDVASFVRAAGIDRPDLDIIGHSWGALVAAALPAAGIRPRRLILLDPPAIPLAAITRMSDDQIDRSYDDLDEARGVIRAANPAWSDGDVLAKAEGLTQFNEPAVRAILSGNGDWDGGLAGLADPAAAGGPAWLVRGEPASGGLVPDETLPAFAERIGASRIVTIAGGPHSPQRTRPEATVLAFLRALDS